jgi:hypothetical protein
MLSDAVSGASRKRRKLKRIFKILGIPSFGPEIIGVWKYSGIHGLSVKRDVHQIPFLDFYVVENVVFERHARKKTLCRGMQSQSFRNYVI